MLLQIEGLNVYHGAFQAVHGIDLHLAAGEVVALIGANGAGKSSLIAAIMGAVDRAEGRIVLSGTSMADLPVEERVRHGVALVPEGRRLFPSLTVEENLGIGLDLGARRRARADDAPAPFALDDVLALFPALRPLLRRPARLLSGGQQQMVSIGRALLMGPRLLLCDEISLGLAPKVIQELYAVLPTILARGISLLIVEQDLQRALAVADRFYCLLEGRVTLDGTPGSVDRDTVVRHYFGMHATSGAH